MGYLILQVETIRYQAEKCKDKFDTHHKTSVSTVEDYLLETGETMSVLDELFATAQHTVRKSHDVEVLEQYQALYCELQTQIIDKQEESTLHLQPTFLDRGITNKQYLMYTIIYKCNKAYTNIIPVF